MERRGDRGHAAGKEQAVAGALQRRQLLLRNALRGITVAPVFFPLDAPLKVVVQLLSIRECVGRRLYDGRREGVSQLWPQLAAMYRQGAEPERFAINGTHLPGAGLSL